MSSSTRGSLPFNILAVCTGNICRSPAVERLLAAALGPTVSVLSAGTRAMVGHPISPPMDSYIEKESACPSDFAARQITEGMLSDADLVLALTRAHRGVVVQLRPAIVRRTFTLRQFARLLESAAPEDLPEGAIADRLRASVPLAAAQQRQRASVPQGDDVIDPYGLGDTAYAQAFAQLLPAVRTIAHFVSTQR